MRREPLLGHVRVLARFKGPNGEIAIEEDRSTGARCYREAGVNQSCVLPGGAAGVEYIRLMATLLAGGADALLLGCGGGALAGMLHRGGSRVTVVDVNPISFQLARTFFWMPSGLECVTADAQSFMRGLSRTFDVIGIDVGGPCFSYERVLGRELAAQARRSLRSGGRIAINVSCETRSDPVAGRIAQTFEARGLEVWVFMEDASASDEVNAIILASARREMPGKLAEIAGSHWTLARLSG